MTFAKPKTARPTNGDMMSPAKKTAKKAAKKAANKTVKKAAKRQKASPPRAKKRRP